VNEDDEFAFPDDSPPVQLEKSTIPEDSEPESPLVMKAGRKRAATPTLTTPKKRMLSSNSKPLPREPTADSVAISGYSSRAQLELEVHVESDPFQAQRAPPTMTRFTRRLTEMSSTSAEPSPEPEAEVLPRSAQQKMRNGKPV
jgi:hypothetical protein